MSHIVRVCQVFRLLKVSQVENDYVLNSDKLNASFEEKMLQYKVSARFTLYLDPISMFSKLQNKNYCLLKY